MCEEEIDGFAAERNFGRGTCTKCIELHNSPEFQAAQKAGYERWIAEREAQAKEAEEPKKDGADA
jgi:hypothetical protein